MWISSGSETWISSPLTKPKISSPVTQPFSDRFDRRPPKLPEPPNPPDPSSTPPPLFAIPSSVVCNSLLLAEI
ncbi:hypothetical protein AALP_AA8G137900 [Arabis alpina]|uniref:Uncharacterized protein n=1 Tax=Arabis alpina TaxID=50452 RepID=A0A087G6W5_ARAAL|nr:hypothetical protein AALP_AA8G137900 [Arabis alpina]